MFYMESGLQKHLECWMHLAQAIKHSSVPESSLVAFNQHHSLWKSGISDLMHFHPGSYHPRSNKQVHRAVCTFFNDHHAIIAFTAPLILILSAWIPDLIIWWISKQSHSLLQINRSALHFVPAYFYPKCIWAWPVNEAPFSFKILTGVKDHSNEPKKKKKS